MLIVFFGVGNRKNISSMFLLTRSVYMYTYKKNNIYKEIIYLKKDFGKFPHKSYNTSIITESRWHLNKGA